MYIFTPQENTYGFRILTVNALILTMNHCREEWVSLPGGFTKTGSPLLVFPDKAQFNYLHVTDLHTLLQYYINVVPRSEQVSMLPALYPDIDVKIDETLLYIFKYFTLVFSLSAQRRGSAHDVMVTSP